MSDDDDGYTEHDKAALRYANAEHRRKSSTRLRIGPSWRGGICIRGLKQSSTRSRKRA